jgi:lysyl-tRNA synthetase class I
MSELQVLVKQNLGSIEFNYEELKQNLADMMALYKDAVVHEDTIKPYKDEVAALRNMKKALSDRRIAVKKEYMKPCDEFEAKVKDLNEPIDEVIDLITKQLDDFEEKRKEKKKQEVLSVYNELIGELKEYLPFTKIYNSKWENVSFKIKAVREELAQVIQSTDQSIQTIQAMNSEAVSKALEQFKSDLSLTNAITYITRYDQQKAEILAREEAKRKEEEERQRLAEIERVKKEERERVAEEERIKEAAKDEVYQEIEVKQHELTERLSVNEQALVEESFPAFLKLIVTKSEIDQIEMYLNSIGVDFEWSNEE